MAWQIFNRNKKQIIVCLGGKNCKCADDVRSKASANPKYLCDIVCKRFNIRIVGCSVCPSKQPEQENLVGIDIEI